MELAYRKFIATLEDSDRYNIVYKARGKGAFMKVAKIMNLDLKMWPVSQMYAARIIIYKRHTKTATKYVIKTFVIDKNGDWTALGTQIPFSIVVAFMRRKR
jgi:hypothetical protein